MNELIVSSHRNRAACARPASASSARAVGLRISRSTAVAIASVSPSGTRTPPSPITSGRELFANAMTGVPHAIASSAGNPNPSQRLVISSAVAPR